MSFFSGNQEKIKKAIQYFHSLLEERKAFVVANLTKIGCSKEEVETLIPLVTAIQNDSISKSQSQISNKLVENGMEPTYAILLVTNIIKEAPSAKYQLKVLKDMDDELFKKAIPSIVRSAWVDKKTNQEIISEWGITEEQFVSIINMIREAMNQLLRRSASEETIKNTLKIDGNFSDNKIETILNTLKINSEFWRDMLVFSNTQDSFFILEDLKQQNNEILGILREMLKIFRESQKGSDQRHYQ